MRAFKCPSCDAIMPEPYKAGQPVTCSNCHQKLQPSRAYLNVALYTAGIIAFAISFLIGFRGVWLPVATLVLWIPVDFIWIFIYVRVVPPRFEPYDSGSSLFPQ